MTSDGAKISLDNMDVFIEQAKEMLEKGEDLSPQMARQLQLTISILNHETNKSIYDEVKKVNGRLKKVEEAVEESEKHPSLLWLLHNKTKTTISIIFVVFMFLSSIYISGIRDVIFTWLGLPPLIP
jgi:hypothetical protein